MPYTLWSHGRLIGYTDLDIHTVTPTMRQGFVDPTPSGKPLLEDATGVWRAMAERRRAIRQGADGAMHDKRVEAAMSRREALDLELRDEHGEMFECEFIRIYDLFDTKSGVVDDMVDTEEEIHAEFEIYLSRLSPEDRAEALVQNAAAEAEIEEFAAEWIAERQEQEMFGSAWPPEIEDPRWDTMQYHLQVHMKGFDDEFLEFEDTDD